MERWNSLGGMRILHLVSELLEVTGTWT